MIQANSERFTSGTDAGRTDRIPAIGRKLIRLSGVIRNYRCTRAAASFVFTNVDRSVIGVIVVAAGAAGLSSQATATAATASATEDADYVEFDLNGISVKGWLWRSPFREGDEVDVAAEWRGEHYEAGAILRIKDRVIAMYPHCSRGRVRHIRNAVKWWLIGSAIAMVSWLGIVAIIGAAIDLIRSGYFYYVVAVSLVFFGLMTFSLARKWMPFVCLTEKMCRTLGLSNPSNVDLVASSKRQRKADDPDEFGTFYFRY